MKADFLRLILRSPVDPARRSLLVEFVETYLPLAGPEKTEFEQIVTADQQYAEVERMITVYELDGIKYPVNGYAPKAASSRSMVASS